MKYVCLVYMDENRLPDVPDRECKAFGDTLRESGRWLAGQALQSIDTATTGVATKDILSTGVAGLGR